MQKIVEDLTSPEWWFSVVVVAILVGLFGVYLARAIDGTGKRLTGALASRSKAAKEMRDRSIEYYTGNPNLIPFLTAKHHLALWESQVMMISALLFLLIAIFVRLIDGEGAPYSFMRGLSYGVATGSLGAFVVAVALLSKASGWALVMWEVEHRLEQ